VFSWHTIWLMPELTAPMAVMCRSSVPAWVPDTGCVTLHPQPCCTTASLQCSAPPPQVDQRSATQRLSGPWLREGRLGVRAAVMLCENPNVLRAVLRQRPLPSGPVMYHSASEWPLAKRRKGGGACYCDAVLPGTVHRGSAVLAAPPPTVTRLCAAQCLGVPWLMVEGWGWLCCDAVHCSTLSGCCNKTSHLSWNLKCTHARRRPTRTTT
jgi:hypothetical protein